jgi:AcrR family transcriptional regulator
MKTNEVASRPSDTRQRILDTAARLFHRQGYNSTGINQLIDEADVAKASLYQHFKSKDDILKAYLEQTSRDWFSGVNAILAQPASPKEKVLAMFDMIRDFSTSVDFRGCNFQNALIELNVDETNTRQFIQNHKSRMAQVFADLLPDAAPDVAAEIGLLFEGALITSQLYHSMEPIDAAKRIVNRVL